MESYYEINVARNGRHLFATAERSCRTLEEAENLYREFVSKFPECVVTVTFWNCIGHQVKMA